MNSSPVPSALQQARRRDVDDLAHPALPQLPALPHQVLEGVHALAHALPRRGVPEGAEQGEDGEAGGGEEDGDVRGFF